MVQRSASIRHVRHRHAYASCLLLIGSGGGVAVLVVIVLRVAAAAIYGVAVDNGEGREGPYNYCCKGGLEVSRRSMERRLRGRVGNETGADHGETYQCSSLR